MVCVNPVTFSAPAGALQPYLPQRHRTAVGGPGHDAVGDVPRAVHGTVPAERRRNLVAGRRLRPAAGDPRPTVTATLGPTWGYHLDDVNLALGNLVTDVAVEEASYR